MAKRRKKSTYDSPMACGPDQDWRARMAARTAARDALQNSPEMDAAVDKMSDKLLPAVKRAMAKVRPFKGKKRRK